MRTIVVIVAIALGSYILLRSTWQHDYRADFVMSVHDDQSAAWVLVIPRIENERLRGSGRIADEIMMLVGEELGQRGFNANRCRVVSQSADLDGTIKYGGRCAWTDAPPQRGI